MKRVYDLKLGRYKMSAGNLAPVMKHFRVPHKIRFFFFFFFNKLKESSFNFSVVLDIMSSLFLLQPFLCFFFGN